jgi:hypothetical protein
MSEPSQNPLVKLWRSKIDALKRWRARMHARAVLHTAKSAFPKAHSRVKAFKGLKSIDANTSHDALARVIHCESEVALLQAKEEGETLFFFVPFSFFGFISLFIVPFAILKWFGVWYGLLLSIGFWYLSLVGSSLFGLIISAPLFIIPLRGRRANNFGAFWFVFSLFSCGLALYNILSHTHSHDVQWYIVLAASSLSQFFVYIAGSLLGMAADWVAKAAVGLRRLANAADSKFVDKILSALEIVHHADRSWTSLSTKNALMRELEEAATIAKQALPRALRTGDEDTDVWLRKRCNEIAASLRAKKTWVCMPKSDTRDRIAESLTRCFLNAVTGTWDGVETAEEPPLTRQDIKLRVRAMFVGLVEALLPAAVYFGAQRLGHLPQGPLSDYLGVGVFLWALIVILLAIDPKFGEKVETLGKVVSLAPGRSKKKEE